MFSPSLFVGVFVILLIISDFGEGSMSTENSKRNSHLKHHSEIHRAKNVIDALSFKLHLNLREFQEKHSSLKQESAQYLTRSNAVKNELKLLNKLKNLLNKLSGNPSSCEKLYSDYSFTASRPIVIRTYNTHLPKNYTMKVQVNHRALIDSGLAMSNGNDLRVFYQKPGECKAREIDRIVENIGTTKAIVLFKLQEEVRKNVVETSTYFLVYSDKMASQAKQNPENVYLFFDDFSDTSFEKKWQTNWGFSRVVNGKLELKTTKTPTGDNAEVAVFVRDGTEWRDIQVELDMMEKNTNEYPGPFLRVKNAKIKHTSAWWFEYWTGKDQCTMRPFKNNNDGSWLYKGTLPKSLTAGTWIHAIYRVVGDRFYHWVNYKLIHNNIKVSSSWMINKGTLGLGCHKSSTLGCHTLYDNIKVTQFVYPPPTISLGSECKVDLKLFHGLGISEKNPATSCKQIHDISLHNGQQRLKNGVYWIKTAADQSIQTYCDLANGGWTLVGKITGHVGDVFKTWLITNHHVNGLTNPVLSSKRKTVSCIDARYLATYHASTIMLASGENPKGIGSKWVKWSLPAGRETSSLWTHAVGLKKVSKAEMEPVSVKAWNGQKKLCYQNKFGIMPFPQHGGSYPSASYNTAGNTVVNDYCMAVGVQAKGTSADGWSQNGNGYDSPSSNNDWPNKSYNHGSPFVAVWLK